MSLHHLATPSDPNGLMGVVMAVKNLLMRQALTLERAWVILLQRENGPETMPEGDIEKTIELLVHFDYREYLVRPVGGGDTTRIWIRPDWPKDRIDFVPFD